MRPGQNKRMRGRNNNPNNNNNNNNRKGPNPLTRSYESNGPDVKIRGTAHHVAEKYLQLARDAQSSGDPVAAESYLQHAEHYFRLIASAQQAQMGYSRQADETDSDDGDDDDVNALPDRFASPPERVQPVFTPPPQPAYAERQPYNGERQPYNAERPVQNNGEQRPSYNGGGERQDRPERTDQNRGNYDRNNGRNDRMGRGPRPPYRDQDGRPDTRADQRPQDNRGPDNRAQDQRPADRTEQPRTDAVMRGDAPRMDRTEAPRIEARAEPTRADTARDYVPERSTPAPRPEPVRREAADEPRLPLEAPVARQPEPPAREAPAREAPALPAFITAPVRVSPPPSEPAAPDAANGHAPTEAAAAADDAPRFPRRRRRTTRAVAAEAGAVETAERPSDAPATNE